jgi:hypothetical protein
MPDTTVLTPVERRRAADRLWQVIAMCDAGKPVSDIREAVRYVAFAMENPTWDGRESTPLNLEAANG